MIGEEEELEKFSRSLKTLELQYESPRIMSSEDHCSHIVSSVKDKELDLLLFNDIN